MYPRARALLWLLLAFCLLSTVHASSKDDDDDEPLCDLKCMIDILNLVMFIFAGGPEEVVPRLIALCVTAVIMFVVLALVAGILSCCGIEAPSERPRGRRRQQDHGPLAWGLTGKNFFDNCNQIGTNWDRWF
tara:strand:+ start:9366 stop:9761 length:396 start_codon:yes stop_codon:yes gene_type:complete